MNKKNVLVFPAGSEIGLEIYKSLRFNKKFNLIGASSQDDHAKFVFENYIEGVPYVEDSDFIEFINKIVKENAIDYIFPAHDSVVLKLAQNADDINAKIVTSSLETATISRSKRMTYEKLKDIVNTPFIYKNAEDVKDYPVFLKPDVGQGSKGTSTANSVEDIKTSLLKDPQLLILEMLPGDEYTVDCFTDIYGKLIYSRARKRAKVKDGISVNSFSVNGEEFADFAERINNTINFTGAWFFQVKRDVYGKLCLLEIAPRIAGTMALSRFLGVNLPLMSLYQLEGNTVSAAVSSNSLYNAVIDRALANRYSIDYHIEKAYVDFDDTVTFDGRINYLIVAFIYRLVNLDREVILITRHSDDIYKTLEKLKLSKDLFSRIIHIKDKSKKSDYIDKRGSIFIDDSYAERLDVSESLGIPVFDSAEIAEMLEGVIK